MKAALLTSLYIGAGGCAGSLARYGVSIVAQRYAATWPLGTLAVNLIGCFAVGVIAQGTARGTALSPEMRLLLATGFCGGFTTMSSFIYEVAQMARAHEYFHAGWYFGVTVAGSLCAFAAGVIAWQLFTMLAGALWN